MSEILLKQGAEARIYIGEYNGETCIIKERFVKKYRHPDLDAQITKERMRAESKAIARCLDAGIETPRLIHMDLNTRKIFLDYYENSITVKDFIIDHIQKLNDEIEKSKELNELCATIGQIIGNMHSKNIIHGDLTTSNMLIDPQTDDFKHYNVVMIDFGLATYSQSLEDKGVDLYVLERALLSTHSNISELFELILGDYKKTCTTGCNEIIAKFEEVRARGRKRTMIG